MYQDFKDLILEREETITAQEYLRRRERGEIDPKDVTILHPVLGAPLSPDAFRVKLKRPRYKLPLGSGLHRGE